MPRHSVSVIIPVYNEEATVERLLAKVRGADSLGLAKEIIAIDDGSTDGTGAVLKNLPKKYGMTVLSHPANLGKGAAVRTGLAAATGDFIVIQDADLEYDPRHHQLLLAPLIEGTATFVMGARTWPRLTPGLMPSFYANRFLTWLTNALCGTGFLDMETGAKAFDAHTARKLLPLLSSKGFDVEPELAVEAARLPKAKVAHVPYPYASRSRRQGKKIGWRDGLQALGAIWKLRDARSTRRAFFSLTTRTVALLLLLAATVPSIWQANHQLWRINAFSQTFGNTRESKREQVDFLNAGNPLYEALTGYRRFHHQEQ